VQVTIRGKRWRLKREKIRGAYGTCDGPNEKGKSITIDPNISGQTELDTIIHECLHAAFWDMDEEAVSEVGTDMARILTRLGYKKGS
jgi:hypothetical protein